VFIVGGNQSAAGGYEVANSCRFDDGSTDYLNRTFSSDTNRTTYTISVWIKRSKISDESFIIAADVSAGAGNTRDFIRFESNDQLRYTIGGGVAADIKTNRLFRDPSAWYHVVVAVDTTQATASNRVKMYINGVQETSFATSSYPSLNHVGDFNDNILHRVGMDTNNTSNGWNGYMSEFVFIDGQQLDPTDLGEFDDSGIWKPIDVSELTFGTNGFYFNFGNSAALGEDSSGNGNNFTVNNLTSIDQSTDTCTNNYPTMNPLDNYYAGSTFSEGNLRVVSTNSNRAWNRATFGLSQGKWYWEIKYVASGGSTPSDKWNHIGISDRPPDSSTDILGESVYQYSVFEDDGKIYASSATGTTYGAAFNTGAIIQIALDLDNNNCYWGVDGQWGNGSGSWNQSTPSSAISIEDPTGILDGVYFPAFGDGGVNVAKTWEANFGSPPFSISSGNSDGNGYGNFEYAVPSGYYAINSKNLAEYG